VDPEIRRCLEEGSRRLEQAGIERPLFEAQVLLALALGVGRADVLRGPDAPPEPWQERRFRELVERRAAREPLAYLRGEQEFFGLAFHVNPRVLVPRPETELLVEFAIEKLAHITGALAVDVGTGSGCIAVAAAVSCPALHVLAIDRSRAALEVARRNARRHGADKRILFVNADLAAAVRPGTAAMVLSNPPYIAPEEIEWLAPEVRCHEPRMALVAEEGGLAISRRLAGQARRVLAPGGWLAVEVAMGQAPQVAAELVAAGFAQVGARRDLAGIERMVIGRWDGTAGK